MFRHNWLGRNSRFFARHGAPSRRSTPWTRNSSRLPKSMSVVIEPLECRRMLSLTPFVWTDKPDYAPGETATFFGTGFQAGETIELISRYSTARRWLDNRSTHGKSSTWPRRLGRSGRRQHHDPMDREPRCRKCSLLELTMTGLRFRFDRHDNVYRRGPRVHSRFQRQEAELIRPEDRCLHRRWYGRARADARPILCASDQPHGRSAGHKQCGCRGVGCHAG